MHIRRDWQKWLVPTDGNKRITAVCGTKTSEKYAGIPGVSNQPVIFDKDGNGGWCIRCCGMALEIFNELFEKHDTSSIVKNMYVSAVDVMSRQILLANSKR